MYRRPSVSPVCLARSLARLSAPPSVRPPAQWQYITSGVSVAMVAAAPAAAAAASGGNNDNVDEERRCSSRLGESSFRTFLYVLSAGPSLIEFGRRPACWVISGRRPGSATVRPSTLLDRHLTWPFSRFPLRAQQQRTSAAYL